MYISTTIPIFTSHNSITQNSGGAVYIDGTVNLNDTIYNNFPSPSVVVNKAAKLYVRI